MLLGDIIKYFLPFHTIQRLSEFQLTFMTYPFHCISYLLFSLLNVLHFFLVKCKSGIKHNLQKYSSIFMHFFTLYNFGYLFYRFHKIICSIQFSLLTITIQVQTIFPFGILPNVLCGMPLYSCLRSQDDILCSSKL